MFSSSHWRIIEHTVPCQHIREYPAATARTQEDILHLAAKQYIPTTNTEPLPGDLTIVIAPGSGHPKELYEPLCEELLVRCTREGLGIRSIWAADPAHQCQSSITNEGFLGYDLLVEAPIVRPVTRLSNNALCDHSTLVRPYLQFSVHRQDTWPSREAATKSLRREAFYQTWDIRVFARLVEHGLRDDPKESHVEGGNGQSHEPMPVRLATPLIQHLASLGRPYHDLPAPDAGPHDPRNRLTHPDLDPELLTSLPFYRPEITALFPRLPHLRPSVLYVYGSKSNLSLPEFRSDKLRTTGIATGGSGGAAAGRVREVVIQGYSHQVPFEAVNECADEVARWLACESKRWSEEEKVIRDRQGSSPAGDDIIVEKRWKVHFPKRHSLKSKI
ncbi:hypothetical protein AbraIFM66950_001352 [Aspergillus brasiliensis]|nr:hypothetical protein AbraIFM66950_001352 [Aspergillus brasiliensis]